MNDRAVDYAKGLSNGKAARAACWITNNMVTESHHLSEADAAITDNVPEKP